MAQFRDELAPYITATMAADAYAIGWGVGDDAAYELAWALIDPMVCKVAVYVVDADDETDDGWPDP